MENIQPKQITLISDTVLSIKWSDEHEGLFFADHLRKNCPCAACENLRVSLEEKAFSNLDDIKIIKWDMLGRYAVGFTFSDGHSTGIYIYENLRSLCQCDICTDNVIRIQGPFG